MKKTRDIASSSSVKIVGDGAIATPDFGEGRMIPVLIVDCSEKVELRDLILAHEDFALGDVTVTWASPKGNKNSILLLLEFSKPSALEVFLAFDIDKQGVLVDGILNANALYLQPAVSGTKVSEGLEKEKIIVEVPETGFFPEWDKIYTQQLVQMFKSSGLSKSESKEAAKQHKEMLREIWSRRM
jgi:hypothetical protein